MERTNYITVDRRIDELAQSVQEYMDGGYLPIGGPSVYKVKSCGDDGIQSVAYRAFQALYKPPPEPPPQPPPTKEEFIQMAAEDFMRGQSGLGEVVEEKPFVGKDGLLDESKLIGLSS